MIYSVGRSAVIGTRTRTETEIECINFLVIFGCDQERDQINQKLERRKPKAADRFKNKNTKNGTERPIKKLKHQDLEQAIELVFEIAISTFHELLFI